ncbi:hypothetical protein [Flavisphingomonas formosensis]|uniref:hypothetical protein n=1 Tax=Flavisphingomonas formosensis TaxID=861534 RepID=UPI0012F801B3|nr:hypothetical protein [Sphingomonas formosensis]
MELEESESNQVRHPSESWDRVRQGETLEEDSDPSFRWDDVSIYRHLLIDPDRSFCEGGHDGMI